MAAMKTSAYLPTSYRSNELPQRVRPAPLPEKAVTKTAGQGAEGGALDSESLEARETGDRAGTTRPPSRPSSLSDQQLARRDREVRAHEMAHLSVGRQYVSQARFSYEKGSNGVLYAVAGEVSVDTAPVPNDPQATENKAEIVHAAALAPRDPSAQDYRVASRALRMAAEARLEQALQRAEQDPDVSGRGDTGRKPDGAGGDRPGRPGSVDVYA